MRRVLGSMRCFLIGSKELSVRVLDELIYQGHEVCGVLVRDGEPGMKIWLEQLGHRALKTRALELKIPVFENLSINSPRMLSELDEMNLDIAFSVFWGEIVKEAALTLPKLGFFNLHTALLPRNRGSFPMAWALIKGEPSTGLTIHKMTLKADAGPIVAQVEVPITEGDTGFSLYQKVTSRGFELFQSTLPKFEDKSFSLALQDEDSATYNIRGIPYAAQADAYWCTDKKERFTRALDYPPFIAAQPPPSPVLQEQRPSVRVMLGFDCDRPRGSYIASREGGRVADQKLRSLMRINQVLEQLELPRTFFICGSFLESMSDKFGSEEMATAFSADSSLVEIADHTYSHSTLSPILTRPDKIPMNPHQLAEEYIRNNEVFQRVFGQTFAPRGLRTPLGSREGLKNEIWILDKIRSLGIPYVSSALRDETDSLHPKLRGPNGKPRQPFRYPNGVIEIPSIGWQDTAFSGLSRTPLKDSPPIGLSAIVEYYLELFKSANELVEEVERDIYLGLVLHPYDHSVYDPGVEMFEKLHDGLLALDGTFHVYQEIAMHFDKSADAKTSVQSP